MNTAVSVQAAHWTLASMTVISAVSCPNQFLLCRHLNMPKAQILFFLPFLCWITVIFSTWFSIPLRSLMIILSRSTELLGHNRQELIFYVTMIQPWKRCFLGMQRDLYTKYSNYVPCSTKGCESHTRQHGGQWLLGRTGSVLFLLGGRGSSPSFNFARLCRRWKPRKSKV